VKWNSFKFNQEKIIIEGRIGPKQSSNEFENSSKSVTVTEDNSKKH